MEDKKLEMAAVLFPAAARLILVEPDNPRAAKLEMLNSLAERFAEPENIRMRAASKKRSMISRFAIMIASSTPRAVRMCSGFCKTLSKAV